MRVDERLVEWRVINRQVDSVMTVMAESMVVIVKNVSMSYNMRGEINVGLIMCPRNCVIHDRYAIEVSSLRFGAWCSLRLACSSRGIISIVLSDFVYPCRWRIGICDKSIFEKMYRTSWNISRNHKKRLAWQDNHNSTFNRSKLTSGW